MSKPYATVTAVDRTVTGAAHLRLDVISGRCPKWLMMKRPPQYFEAIVGTTLEITWSAVYVKGELWAKRLPRSPNEIVLIARGK